MAGNTPSERLLWEQLKSGNHQAIEKIYREHFGFLYNYGCKIATDAATVEDCIQELFVEIWQRRERLSSTDAIRPYLTISLKRKLIRSVKKVRKSTDVELEDNMFGTEEAIDALMIGAETNAVQKKKLNEALSQLPSRQKEILYMRYYAEMDYEAISQAMDMNYQSARNLLSRALQKLSKSMIATLLLIFYCSSEYKTIIESLLR